jgi:hypothetical protein
VLTDIRALADYFSLILSCVSSINTTHESLVHKLGCKRSRNTKELLDIATSHASGEEAVRAIFNRSRGKAKRDEDTSEGASNCSKKKNKQWLWDSLVAAAKRKGKKAPTEGAPDHFENLLEGPCSNRAYPMKHMYKDCSLMKRFLSGGSNRGDKKKKPDPSADDVEEKEGAFLETTGCLMIFDKMVVYDSKCRQKLMCARST